MHSQDLEKRERKVSLASGRIRPLLLGIVILILGLIMDKWWWQVGVFILVVVFIETYYRYRTLD